jgi:hydroxypyruvate reductase
MTDLSTAHLRSELLACFDTMLAAVRPGPALAGALDGVVVPEEPPRVLAIGKAAAPMARTAAAWLGARGIRPAAGLVIAPESAPAAGLPVMTGNHPWPGPESAAAAEAIATFCRATPPDTDVWLLLSGGATSLMAGPETGLTLEDLRESYDLLLASGLDIGAMNLVRKRLSRWGGGKLAAALAQARVSQFLISDVPGDALDAIGSGPAVPDTGTAGGALDVIEAAGLRSRLPRPAMRRLDSMAAGEIPDLPPADAHAFARVTTVLVATNRTALEAGVDLGRSLGWRVHLEETPLSGEAAIAGVRLAEVLLAASKGPTPWLFVAGGETPVTLQPGTTGMGGRCQELALAAANLLRTGPGDRALLAAGTDGRDGPTDAAGALVDSGTWGRIRDHRLDPTRALEEHDAYPALQASGDLLRTGPTGTNVGDVVAGMVM